jgi:3-oxoacyl-(acyl-carrier-protein) synthase
MVPQSRYDYINQDLPGDDILAVLGELPKRWGRMDKISRLAVVEVGRILLAYGMLGRGGKSSSCRGRGGLIGLTRRGSLTTDLAYADTLKQGLEVASPTLFSYTLANIALAEAASHYGLIGPVYSVFADDPGSGGEAEARRWLACDNALDFMIVGELDVCPAPLPCREGEQARNPDDEIVSANFRIVS